jgi:hypothetical protein
LDFDGWEGLRRSEFRFRFSEFSPPPFLPADGLVGGGGLAVLAFEAGFYAVEHEFQPGGAGVGFLASARVRAMAGRV